MRLLKAYYVQSTALGTGREVVSKIDKVLPS